MIIDEKDFISFARTKQGLSESSVRNCVIRTRVINRWFVEKDLTKENVEKFFAHLIELGKKNNTLNTYRFVFRQLDAYYKDRGLEVSFLDGFKSFKKTKPDIIIFTKEEIEKIINTSLTYGSRKGRDCSGLDFMYRTCIMFLAYTGCRISEALNLKVKRLDISAGKAMFIDTKTNENRTVFFYEPLVGNLKILTEGREPDDHVFRNTTGGRLQVTDFNFELKRRTKAAGVTKRSFPHNFRHSYITHMLEAGVPITEVASLVGHKDIQTTYSTYMHLADTTLQKAAMRHPLVRRNIEPSEVIKTIKEALENFHLEDDSRLSYELSEGNGKLGFNLSVK
jgi:integrase/recombinase XerD